MTLIEVVKIRVYYAHSNVVKLSLLAHELSTVSLIPATIPANLDYSSITI